MLFNRNSFGSRLIANILSFYLITSTVMIPGADAMRPLRDRNDLQVPVAVPPSARLDVTKVADDAEINPGQNVGYTITVLNNSQIAAQSVQLTDPLPEAIGVSEWTIDGGNYSSVAKCSMFLKSLYCEPATLPAGASFTVHVKATTDGSSAGASLSSAARVKSPNSNCTTDESVGCSQAGTIQISSGASDVSNVEPYSNFVPNAFLASRSAVKLAPAFITPNPDLAPFCGLNVVVALDASGSIDSSEQGQVRSAVNGLISALQGTGSSIAFVEFGTTADTPVPYTLDIAANAAVFSNYLSATNVAGPQYHDGRVGQNTNWDAALIRIAALNPAPDLVLFVTDGVPTAIGVSGTAATTQVAADTAAMQANTIKSNAGNQGNGSHILTIGVGIADADLINMYNLTDGAGAVSYNGSNFPTADYVSRLDFNNLLPDMSTISSALCSSSMTITKTVDETGAGTYSPQPGWLFNASVVETTGSYTWTSPNAAPAGSISGTTNTNGQLFFQWVPNSNLATSTITLTEVQQPGYQLVDVNCSVGGTPVSVAQDLTFSVGSIPKNSFAACAVRNRRLPGSITIVKTASPSDSTSFSFTTTGTGLNSFSLVPNGVNTETFSNLPNATYTVTETDTSGWGLHSLNCTGGTSTSTNLSTRTATINLSAGENVVCTFNNQQQGRLIVQKVTVPANDPTVFTVNATGTGTIVGGGAGTISTSTPQNYTVSPGTYSVAETIPAGWDKTGDTCQNLSIASGQTVTCRITNTRRATLNVRKVTNPANDPTVFNINATGTGTITGGGAGTVSTAAQKIYQVTPGTYSVTETVPPGWTKTTDTCQNVTLAPGQNVTCNITNVKHQPAINLVKNGLLDMTIVSPTGRADAGDRINYTFAVTNPGNVPLTSVALTDPRCDSAPVRTSGDTNSNNALDLTETWNYTCAHTLTQTDVNAGQVVNNASVSGTSPASGIVTATASVTVTIPGVEGIALNKAASPTTYNAVGQNITYTYTIRNIGNTTLGPAQFTISDDRIGSPVGTEFQCPPGNSTLLPNATITCSAAYPITQDDLDAGFVTNNATARGAGLSAIDTATVTATRTTTLNLVKAAAPGSTYQAVGDTISYTYTLTNNGNVTLTGPFTVNDDKATVTCPNTPSLAPGVSLLCTATYAVVAADITNESVVNFATGYAFQGATEVISNTATATVNVAKARLRLVKAVVNDNGGTAPANAWLLSATGTSNLSGAGSAEGDVIAGSYVLSETGGPAAYNSSLDCGPSVTIGANNTITLNQGDNVVCTFTNNDKAPILHLRKNVTNNNGGTAADTAWTLTATGPTTLSGITPTDSDATFRQGTYTLSETGPAGYTLASIVCADANFNIVDVSASNQIVVNLGDEITCTFNNDDQPPSLRLRKVVANNHGGSAAATAWTLNAQGPTPLSGPTPVNSNASFTAGTYTLGESGGPSTGYEASLWTCVDDVSGQPAPVNGAQVSVGLGQSITCTIVNSDQTAHLTLNKTVINDNGGTNVANDFHLSAAGPTPFGGNGTASADVDQGSYTLSETTSAGYLPSNWTCTDDNSPQAPILIGNVLTLALGQSVTCEIMNDDVSAHLTLVKEVMNTHGGTAIASQFTLRATGGPTTISGPGRVEQDVSAGVYTLSENNLPGYAASPWTCVDDVTGASVPVSSDDVRLVLGQRVTCSITNRDQAATLTLQKQVLNPNGGTNVASDFTLRATGPTNLIGQGAATGDVSAGTYTLSESGPAGYTASPWTCTDERTNNAVAVDSNARINIALNQLVTCRIANTDQVAHLNLEKVVLNPNGGSAVAGDFTLRADGPTPVEGAGAASSDVNAGVYTLSESGPAGYTASSWVCSLAGGTPAIQNGNQVTLLSGQTVDCTITNTDQSPRLSLVKTVTNSNGGAAVAADFTLRADGPTVLTGAGAVSGNVDSGVYTLSEDGPSGYTSAAGWDCRLLNGTPATQSGNQVTLSPGQNVTCSIINTDNPSQLTLAKVMDKRFNGAAVATDFTLAAQGPTPFSGQGNVTRSVNAGAYTLTESGPAGYTASAWVCVDNNNPATPVSQNANQVTLASGQAVTCTITNSDQSARLKLTKIVTNSNGGSAVSGDFTLRADGPTPVIGAGSASQDVNAGVYTLSETGPAGYTSNGWDCRLPNGNPANQNGNQLTVLSGQTVDCTITNTDNPSQLTLVKAMNKRFNGAAVATDFTLNAQGPTPFSGQGTVTRGVNAGTYTLSESGPTGYTASAWVCVDDNNANAPVSQNGNQVTLAPQQFVTCTITNTDQTARLNLTKVVLNPNRGSAVADDFTLRADGPTPVNGAGSVSRDVNAGVYTLSESGPAGYTASAWTCSLADGTPAIQNGNLVTLLSGQTVDCTITNTDQSARLSLVKTVTNSNGGSAVAADFTLRADGPTVLIGAGAVSGNVNAGNYRLTESGGPAGYTASSWLCVDDTTTLPIPFDVSGDLPLSSGQRATCTITNSDSPSRLTLVKTVTNNFGGTAVAGNFTLTAQGPTSFSGQGNVTRSVNVGTYTLSESGPAGYTASGWDCRLPNGNSANQNSNQVTLATGQTVTCTITNNDQSARLTLVKTVSNTNGGSAQADNFTLTATGPTILSGPGGASGNVNAGTYRLSETGTPAGYTASAWSCVDDTTSQPIAVSANGDVTLSSGQRATCTIINSDNPARLTLAKSMNKRFNGAAVASDFTLSAQGPTPFSGQGNVTRSVNVGTYTLTESGPAGYIASAWICVDDNNPNAQVVQSGNQVTLASQQFVTCTITNSDQTARLTLNKVVTNANGGTAVAGDFTLRAEGPTPISGAGSVSRNVNAGNYRLSESGGPAGYTATAWSCVDDTTGNPIPLNLNGELPLLSGQSATCTITNTDSPARLTLAKSMNKRFNGAAVATDFTLSAQGPTPFSGLGSATSAVNVGTYTLSETGPAGYTASAWVCVDDTNPSASVTQNGSQVTLAPNQEVTCTITNSDQTAHLNLAKIVSNANNGPAVPTNFTLTATGPTTISGAGSVSRDVNAGVYTLSESGPAGYTATGWDCRLANGSPAAQNGNQVTLLSGQTVDCTITNNDQPARLTLTKVVTNTNGGTAVADDFTLRADGPTPVSGDGSASRDVSAGVYTLSESGPAGYTSAGWICRLANGNTANQNGNQVTLANGQTVNCSITNTDNASRLTLVKVMNKRFGDAAEATDFTLSAQGPTPFSGQGTATRAVNPGAYTLTESGPAGYLASAWVCVDDNDPANPVTQTGNVVTVALGQAATCTITNSDQTAHLNLVKVVTNANGGSAVATDFTLRAEGPTPVSGAGSVSRDVNAGDYRLSESGGPAGYTASSWECVDDATDRPIPFNSNGELTLISGQSATCTITNTDSPSRLTLVKAMNKRFGGSAVATDFTLNAQGPTPFSGQGNVTRAVNPGTYTLTESGPLGYLASAWVCVDDNVASNPVTQNGNQVTLPLGQSVTCTITNSDQTARVNLVKVVNNSNGGGAQATDFLLTARDAGGAIVASGAGVASADVPEGTYSLSEAGPAGYTRSDWICSDALGPVSSTGDQVRLVSGQTVTCTITNSDQAARLTLNKQVTNTYGGTATAADFTLTASSSSIVELQGQGSASGFVKSGTYDLGESGPTGYTASPWTCVDDTTTLPVPLNVNGQLVLASGQAVTCDITNTDEPGTLIVQKVVISSLGQASIASDFSFTVVDGSGTLIAGPTNFVETGDPLLGENVFQVNSGAYTITEEPNADYTASYENCSNVVVSNGETVICTITNTHVPFEGCTYNQAFWQTHDCSDVWPVEAVVINGRTFTRTDAQTIFSAPSVGNAALGLLQQLIVAQLNIAGGASATPVSPTITDAGNLLAANCGQALENCVVDPSSPEGQQMANAASILQQYNEGAYGLPTCTAQPVCPPPPFTAPPVVVTPPTPAVVIIDPGCACDSTGSSSSSNWALLGIMIVGFYFWRRRSIRNLRD